MTARSTRLNDAPFGAAKRATLGAKFLNHRVRFITRAIANRLLQEHDLVKDLPRVLPRFSPEPKKIAFHRRGGGPGSGNARCPRASP